ncbi:MAG: GNAT family N-acetyltransferase [Actinobacteria bacterium]|nr:GNAT family N-acetyltransferase [Actinomycetota bacterium]
MSYTIESVAHDWTDEVVADINAFENAWRLEIDPEIPPMPASTTRAHRDLREVPNTIYAARADGGSVVGTAWVTVDEHNPQLVFALIAVASAHRRRGVATSLLEKVVEQAEGLGRPNLVFGADQVSVAPVAFGESLGASIGLRAHINRLVVADVDRELMRAWVDESDDDYALEWITPDGSYPDESIADMARLRAVLLNDAPMDDVPVLKRTISFEEIRIDEQRLAGYGKTRWTLIARHRASGTPVGYTEIVVDPNDARTVNQGATAVDGQHRGHRLGRQMKAAMFQRVVRDLPHIRFIRTFNADSNEPMLAVNDTMGFKPHFEALRWLIDTTDAKTWLEKRR